MHDSEELSRSSGKYHAMATELSMIRPFLSGLATPFFCSRPSFLGHCLDFPYRKAPIFSGLFFAVGPEVCDDGHYITSRRLLGSRENSSFGDGFAFLDLAE
jgi:hypothetical protein